MKPGQLVSLVGFTLIAGALVLHIVCLATPYYGRMDVGALFTNALKMSKTNILAQNSNNRFRRAKILEGWRQASKETHNSGGIGTDLSLMLGELGKGSNDMKILKKVMDSVDFHVGMWKACVSFEHKSINFKKCVKWGSGEFPSNPAEIQQMNKVDTPGWMRGVQAMAILGLLVMAAGTVMSGISLLIPSKGDRLRLFPLILTILCLIGGVLCLVGDVIFAAHFKHLFEDIMPPEVIKKLEPEMKDVIFSLISGSLFLSWGFALDIVASVVALLSGIVFIVGARVTQSTGGIV